MKFQLSTSVVLFLLLHSTVFSQNTAKTYTHKAVVDSVIQTKAYTYLKVSERIKEKDSIQWLALPLIEAKTGTVYYFDGGLPMGEFQSKELNRTFKQIQFLSYVSTTLEVSEKTVLPLPVFDTIKDNTPPPPMHTVVVKEVIQTSGYTYLRVKEGNKEEWLAIVKIQAKVGQTFHFDDAAPMTDFTSKELKRTFPEILFLAKLNPGAAPAAKEQKPSNVNSNKKTKKYGHSIEVNSIANLFENKKMYANKMVLIKGEITKYSSNILDKNWIHIKDGSNYLGQADLVITTESELKIGDKVTFEGLISLDKNFGSGYFFEVIMEDASVK